MTSAVAPARFTKLSTSLTLSRRAALAGPACLLAASAIRRTIARAGAAEPMVLKLGHPYAATDGDASPGDFRDRLARRFADEVTRRTGGALGFTLYPNASFTRSEASFSAVRHGALDLLLAPLTRAASDVPEAAIGTMPGLVTSYDQGARWRDSAVGSTLDNAMRKRGGARILCWIWTQGAVISRARPVFGPEDIAGLRVRGGSPAIDTLIRAAGGKLVALAGPDLHEAFKRGRVDAAIVSTSGLIGYGLRDSVTTLAYPEGAGPWFMLSALMIAEPLFAKLPADQQAALTETGRSLEAWAIDAARGDDAALPGAFRGAGVDVRVLAPDAIEAWRNLARLSAWKAFAAQNDRCAALLAAAQALG